MSNIIYIYSLYNLHAARFAPLPPKQNFWLRQCIQVGGKLEQYYLLFKIWPTNMLDSLCFNSHQLTQDDQHDHHNPSQTECLEYLFCAKQKLITKAPVSISLPVLATFIARLPGMLHIEPISSSAFRPKLEQRKSLEYLGNLNGLRRINILQCNALHSEN